MQIFCRSLSLGAINGRYALNSFLPVTWWWCFVLDGIFFKFCRTPPSSQSANRGRGWQSRTKKPEMALRPIGWRNQCLWTNSCHLNLNLASWRTNIKRLRQSQFVPSRPDDLHRIGIQIEIAIKFKVSGDSSPLIVRNRPAGEPLQPAHGWRSWRQRRRLTRLQFQLKEQPQSPRERRDGSGSIAVRWSLPEPVLAWRRRAGRFYRFCWK